MFGLSQACIVIEPMNSQLEMCILNSMQEPMFLVSGLSSFGFGGTNAHVTCKSSETAVETKVENRKDGFIGLSD